MDVVEVIKEGEIIRMAEDQALREDLFILRKIEPEANVVPEVRNLESERKKDSPLEEWKMSRGNVRKNNVVADLIDNFHWDVIRKRRDMGLTRKQLADEISESEEDLKIVELGDLPRDDFVLVTKLEKRLRVVLRKEKPAGVTLADLQKMNAEKAREAIDSTHGIKKETREKVDSISGEDIEILD